MKILEASKIQRQFWILNNMYSETGAYNLFSIFELSGNFDPSIFKKAAQVIINRHEALRTIFKFENNEVWQYNLDTLEASLIEIKIDEDYVSGKIHQKIFEEANTPFNLSIAPLFRFKLFRFNNEISVLSLVFHHIIIDVRSENIFAKEISEVYNAFVQNTIPNLEDVQYQYPDYTTEILNYYKSDEYKVKLNHFIEEYPDPNIKIELPEDFSSSRKDDGEGASTYFELGPETVEDITAFGKSNNVNTYRILLTAYAILLHRLSNQDQVTIGLPLTNRTRPVSKNTFGCYINALPLNVNFESNITVAEVIQQIDNGLKQNLDRQEIPFTELVNQNTVKKSTSHSPFFQTGFAIKPPMQLALNNIEAKPLKVKKNGAQLNLFFTFWPEGNCMVGLAEYSTLLFSELTILRWIDNFKVLLKSMISHPESAVDNLEMLTEKDKETWKDFNNTDCPFEDSICLQEKFERQVVLTPKATAIIWGNKSLSYEELNIQANRLAHYLKHSGVTPGGVVAFSLERCPELIISILAIHKTGCAYLPFDTKAPTERLESIIEDAKPQIILTKTGSDANLPKNSINRLNLDNLLVQPIHQDTSNPDLALTSRNLAYILYTSGSTGKPKGVMIEHRSVLNKIGWMQYKYATDSSDTLVLKTPVTFDVSVWELFWWFFNGSKLLILPPGAEKEPETIISEVEREKASVIIFVPSMFASFIAYLEGMDQTERLSSLKLIIQIGEALSPQLVKKFNTIRTAEFNPLMLNTYGPTEATVAVSYYDCPNDNNFEKIFIGKPIFNTKLLTVNKNLNIQPIGIPGELVITGVNLSPGYLNRPDLNKEKFVMVKDVDGNTHRAYLTGDLAILDKSGEIDFIGRADNQVKFRGFRIELGEIESKLMEYQEITNCAVIVHDPKGPNPQLIAYITTKNKIQTQELKSFLAKKVPDYMIPAHFVVLETMPLTTSGKINRKALPEFKDAHVGTGIAPQNKVEQTLIDTYKKIIGIDQVNTNSNFFEIGGTSILVPLIVVHLKKEYNITIKTLNLFEFPTVSSLASYIINQSQNDIAEKKDQVNIKSTLETEHNRDIAVIGMSGCFPGAENLQAYWENIVNGKVTITHFTREELALKGVSQELLDNPDYVYANGIIDRGDKFDASFFGITPREADFMDPQHRLFLEVCYEALEDAGYAKIDEAKNIGVFAGTGMNSYLLKSLIQHPDALRNLGEFQTMINNDKDFLTTRVSYKLNLTGPSFNVQTACSTSLVALHMACQSLLNNECEMALTGGAYVHNPRGNGYMFKQGGILSPTGFCRPFDSKADGTVLGEGCGAVMLKRLNDAIKDNDNILAVIKATAINNDGANKVGYMAPSIEGQSMVIRKAQALANVTPDSISYIETHGTGTKLGDPIEISALKKAFGTSNKKHCALGAVKANIGHLDAAAGIAGFIKTVLALRHKQIPPLTNFTGYNSELDIENSPFYAPATLKKWEPGNGLRRAAVSSFGIGGTNAHCILEEWDKSASKTENTNKFHILPLSAKNDWSLKTLQKKYAEFLVLNRPALADTAYTLQYGRTHYKNRSACIIKTIPDTAGQLEKQFISGKLLLENPRVVFMYTGQGSQYVLMAKGLYEEFATFRQLLDEANTKLLKITGIRLIDTLYGQAPDTSINNTSVAQPLLFVVQYAITKLLSEFGIKPDALIGHSIGELTAACISGVYSFDDALTIVANRGKLMQLQAPGAMLSVQKPADVIKPLLYDGLEVALHNAPDFCVVSGPLESITNFENLLLQKLPGTAFSKLATSHAFHSKMMEPAMEPFKQVFSTVIPGESKIPFISNVTGTWITKAEASSPDYWASHIRSMVDFKSGVEELLKESNNLFIEIGPGNSLTSLLSQFSSEKKIVSIPTLRHPKKEEDDCSFFLKSVAQIWINGGKINWDTFHQNESRKRIPLPTYPFDRKKHWVDPVVPFSFDIAYHHEQKTNGTDYSFQADHADHSLYRSFIDNEYVAPQNETEKELIILWQEILGIPQIGASDNFFDLGGHSLLAAQITHRINEQLKISLPLNIIFNAPTIRELAVKASQCTPATTKGFAIKPVQDISGELPITYDQKRLWIISKIDNNPAYNIPFTYKFTGDLNVGLFSKSLNILFNRHKILRSCIKTKSITTYCSINQTDNTEVNFKDISSLPEDEKAGYIQSILGNEIRTLFNIDRGPLYRIYLIKTAENEHIFHFTIQHLVFDGWSWGIFVKELKLIYSSLLNNQPVSLPELPFHYFDYAAWQTDKTNEPDYSASVNYWKQQLEGHSPAISFPYDHQRKSKSSGLGGREEFVLDAKLTKEIKKISSNENATDFMTLVSAFAILLNRYSGDSDINIGTPTANRSHSDLEKIIGFFVNTLVLRFNFEKNFSYRQFLQGAKKTILDALDHQELPFEKLVEVLQPARSFNINPVFQILFAWQNTPRPSLDLEGTYSEKVLIKDCVSPLDITVYMWENQGQIEGEIEFSTDILERETIIRLKNNFITLLQAIAFNPDSEIQALPIVSEDEQKMLNLFNKTQVDLPDKLLHQLFEEQTQKSPDSIAAICGDEKISYSQLNHRANALADILLKLNISEGDVVGINVERGLGMLVSVLAVLKCGACYLPLDPSFPDDRLQFMLQDSGAGFLITQQSFLERYQNYSGQVITIDKLPDAGTQILGNPNRNISSHSLAYMIYTSGSTGRPKGVKVHHEAVVNFILSMATRPGFKSSDKILAVTTLSFDISILELFLPISMGGMVVITKADEVYQGKLLIAMIEKFSISILQATPATWNILIKSGWMGNSGLTALCGGEALSQSLAEQLLPRVRALWNMYGPTETTVWSTCHQIKDAKTPILVGKPINNTQLYILKNGQIQPIGVSGDVFIGGSGVSKGYHNREELTKEKFITSPHSELIYNTGDLGCLLPDGNLRLFGRSDDQVKLRGYRIELSEIEKTICEVAGISEAVVRIFQINEIDVRLVGFVTTNNNPAVNNEDIFKHLQARLPAYMIPSTVKKLDSFPRTPNGKIDKKALTFQPEFAETNETEILNLTDFERDLYKIWATELNSSSFGINDNFFDIGGNSVMLVQLATRVNEFIGKELDILTYFTYPSIKSFSNYIVNANNDNQDGMQVPTMDRRSEQLAQMGLRRRNR